MKKLIIMVVAAGVLTSWLGSANAQGTPPPFVYSVKFLCGLQTVGSSAFTPPREPPVKPGNYATAINIHNFHSGTTTGSVEFCKKAVIALPESVQPRGQISPIKFDALGPDQALEVDCSDIVSLFPAGTKLPPFIKGFVEINSPLQLSVTAVYTSQTCRNPSSFKIGPVPQFCTNLGELELQVVPQNYFVGDTECVSPAS